MGGGGRGEGEKLRERAIPQIRMAGLAWSPEEEPPGGPPRGILLLMIIICTLNEPKGGFLNEVALEMCPKDHFRERLRSLP